MKVALWLLAVQGLIGAFDRRRLNSSCMRRAIFSMEFCSARSRGSPGTEHGYWRFQGSSLPRLSSRCGILWLRSWCGEILVMSMEASE